MMSLSDKQLPDRGVFFAKEMCTLKKKLSDMVKHKIYKSKLCAKCFQRDIEISGLLKRKALYITKTEKITPLQPTLFFSLSSSI